MKNKKNIVEAVLYGSVLVLLIILLIFSKNLRKQLLHGDDAADTTETQSQIQKGTDMAPEITENETAVQAYDPASVTTEVMDGVPEAAEPVPESTQPVSEEGGNQEGMQPVSEEPYDGENNF